MFHISWEIQKRDFRQFLMGFAEFHPSFCLTGRLQELQEWWVCLIFSVSCFSCRRNPVLFLMHFLFFRRSFPEGGQESLQQDDEPKSVSLQRRRSRCPENIWGPIKNVLHLKCCKSYRKIPLKSFTAAVCWVSGLILRVCPESESESLSWI